MRYTNVDGFVDRLQKLEAERKAKRQAEEAAKRKTEVVRVVQFTVPPDRVDTVLALRSITLTGLLALSQRVCASESVERGSPSPETYI